MKFISLMSSKYVLSCSTKRAMTGSFRGALCSLGVLKHLRKEQLPTLLVENSFHGLLSAESE